MALFRSLTNQSTPPRATHLRYGWAVYAPLIAFWVWIADLIALLGLWAADGHPRYDRGARIVFVSDVGAYNKTVFIVLNCVTIFFYILSLLLERWLRHVDRIPGTVRSRERTCDIAAIIFGCIGGAALILLAIFDDVNYATAHWSMTLVFIVGVALSAICQTFEVWALASDHPDRAHLRRNSIVKLFVVGIAICLAISFGGTYGVCGGDAPSSSTPDSEPKCQNITSAAAALEWTTAFVLAFYFLTLALDLYPAAKSSPRYLRRLAKWEEKHMAHIDHALTSGPAPAGPPAGHATSIPDDRTVVGDSVPMQEAKAGRWGKPTKVV